MNVKVAAIQATVVAFATLALVSFIAIRDGADNTFSWWAIPLAWAFVYGSLMLVSAYLAAKKRNSVWALRAATVLCSLALVVSIGGLPISPVVAIITLSSLWLLIGIQRQARVPGSS